VRRLGVNIDHVATVRQQRKGATPEPVYAALIAQAHGADGIVAHLREDRRHIQDRDVRLLKQVLSIPFHLEMAATEEMERFALDLAPRRVCLVPEKRQELTTEGGLDVIARRSSLKKTISRFSAKKIEVSLFVDPDSDQIRCAKSLGADAVELHTGRYAEAAFPLRPRELAQLIKAAELASRLKLQVHAGHGLDYRNIGPVAQITAIEEFNIGFSIISQALFVGLGQAVQEMKDLLN
jgi:pyridoxine 5-phosphate synthase